MNQRILLISTVALFFVTETPVFSVEPQTEKEAAIAAVRKLGGRVLGDQNNPSKPVEGVVFSNTKFTDAGLEALVSLKGLAELSQLHLVGTQVTDAGLVHLKGLTKLRTLSLGNTKVTDTGLVHLKGLPELRELRLSNHRGSEAMFVHSWPTDRRQYLGVGPTITDAGLLHLKEMTKLQSVVLTNTKVTDAGLRHLKELTELQGLSLYGTQVTDAGLSHLEGLTKLEALNLLGTGLSRRVANKHVNRRPPMVMCYKGASSPGLLFAISVRRSKPLAAAAATYSASENLPCRSHQTRGGGSGEITNAARISPFSHAGHLIVPSERFRASPG